jgi:hypothetical protein
VNKNRGDSQEIEIPGDFLGNFLERDWILMQKWKLGFPFGNLELWVRGNVSFRERE